VPAAAIVLTQPDSQVIGPHACAKHIQKVTVRQFEKAIFADSYEDRLKSKRQEDLIPIVTEKFQWAHGAAYALDVPKFIASYPNLNQEFEVVGLPSNMSMRPPRNYSIAQLRQIATCDVSLKRRRKGDVPNKRAKRSHTISEAQSITLNRSNAARAIHITTNPIITDPIITEILVERSDTIVDVQVTFPEAEALESNTRPLISVNQGNDKVVECFQSSPAKIISSTSTAIQKIDITTDIIEEVGSTLAAELEAIVQQAKQEDEQSQEDIGLHEEETVYTQDIDASSQDLQYSRSMSLSPAKSPSSSAVSPFRPAYSNPSTPSSAVSDVVMEQCTDDDTGVVANSQECEKSKDDVSDVVMEQCTDDDTGVVANSPLSTPSITSLAGSSTEHQVPGEAKKDKTKDNKKELCCPDQDCAYTCVKSGRLNRHMKDVHTKPFQCGLCSKSFGNMSKVNRHMKTHIKPE